jgi:hypothetical protein
VKGTPFRAYSNAASQQEEWAMPTLPPGMEIKDYPKELINKFEDISAPTDAQKAQTIPVHFVHCILSD